MDDTLTALTKLAELYGVPAPPYPIVNMQEWVLIPHVYTLHVRRGPGQWADAIRYLTEKDKVTILREVNGWAEIDPGQWVNKQYLRRV